MSATNIQEIKWNRIYVFILGYNAILVILFYVLKLFYNQN